MNARDLAALSRPWQYANTPRFRARNSPPRLPVAWAPPEGIPRANGYVLYEGPSRFNGDPIILVVTGFIEPSENTKTGQQLLQTWILARDVHPQDYVWSGDDTGICGNCVHRGVASGGKVKGRSCYVVLSHAPLGVWNGYHAGRYPKIPPEWVRPLMASIGAHRMGIRIGSYGDPVAVPVQVWEEAIGAPPGGDKPIFQVGPGGHYEIPNANVPFWTGYTHAWKRSIAQPYKWFLMASVDSIPEQRAAAAAGWRTFRVGRAGEPLVAGSEIVCPASKEGGYRTTCDKCLLCMGACKPAQNIVIAPHGSGARFHEERGRRLPRVNPDEDARRRAREAGLDPSDVAALERAFNDAVRVGDEAEAYRLWTAIFDAENAALGIPPWSGMFGDDDFPATRRVKALMYSAFAPGVDPSVNDNPGHRHPRLRAPHSRARLERELRRLYGQARLPHARPEIKWPNALARLHERVPRRYAQVWTGGGARPRFELAEQARWLPAPHRRGLFAHEIGHVLVPEGGEDEADLAAAQVLGVRIAYDPRWGTHAGRRGLEVARNPYWEDYSERDRVGFKTRAARQLGRVLRLRFPVEAAWSPGGGERYPILVHGPATWFEPWASHPARTWGPNEGRWLVAEFVGGPHAGDKVLASATSLYDATGRVWVESLPKRRRGLWQENPGDEDLRELERAAATGDAVAQQRLIVERKRRGIERTEDQIVQARVEIAFTQRGDGSLGGGRQVAFPEATRWRDLFDAETPTRTEETYPLPPELIGKDYQTVKAWALTRFPKLTHLQPQAGASVTLAVGETDFSIVTVHPAPRGWAAPWRGEEPRPPTRSGRARPPLRFTVPIGPYCSVEDTSSHKSLYVKLVPRVVEWIMRNMLLTGPNGSISFEAVVRRSNEHPDTLLVLARYSNIIGSRYLAILPANELPVLP